MLASSWKARKRPDQSPSARVADHEHPIAVARRERLDIAALEDDALRERSRRREAWQAEREQEERGQRRRRHRPSRLKSKQDALRNMPQSTLPCATAPGSCGSKAIDRHPLPALESLDRLKRCRPDDPVGIANQQALGHQQLLQLDALIEREMVLVGGPRVHERPVAFQPVGQMPDPKA